MHHTARFLATTRRITLMLVSSLLLLALAGSQPAAVYSEDSEHLEQPDQQCFAETDFCISGRIRQFWQQHGGLPVFGLPIAPLREEQIDGVPVQVQWFERTRLELHPENAPPYDVLLGRVGVEALQQQGRDWHSFPASEPQEGCRSFAETGHNVCGAILQMWQGNGLELDGAPGTSTAESLALFGLPLSDAELVTVTASEPYTVQWFERARIEHHHDNPPEAQVLLGLLGRELAGSTPPPSTGAPPAAVDERLVRAQTGFGFALFHALRSQATGQNIFISPTSAAFALSMTYNGADGATRDAMATALQLEGMSLEEVNQASSALLAALQSSDPDVQMNIANALWARQGIAFDPDFLQRNRDSYQAEVATLDFEDPAAVATINAWVSEQTNGKIPTILDRIDPELILLLINAVYFKGAWTIAFDEAETSEQPFTLLDGSQKQVPLMQQTETHPYYRGEGFQAVSLPYGEEERMRMHIFLPDEERSLDAFYQQLDAEAWATWMGAFEEREGTILLPRFTLEYEQQLQDALSALGMGVAFDCDNANFTRMYPPGACLSFVKQKAFVEVNEAGTEAAAATVVGAVPTSAMPPGFFMRVDRPFFFTISDSATGTVLFMGSVVEL
jgi:serpin B